MNRVELVATLIASAIGLEAVVTPKPGNVHRRRDFEDTTLEDFIWTSHSSVPIVRSVVERGWLGERAGLGEHILAIVEASKLFSRGNPALGTATLLIPLGYGAGRALLKASVDPVDVAFHAREAVLDSDVEDAVMFYRALRRAAPSYLGRVEENLLPDVWDEGYEEKLRERGVRLWHVLWISSKWDIVSRELVEGYGEAMRALRYLEGVARDMGFRAGVVHTYLYILSRNVDSLILRKHGLKAALKASRMASRALRLGGMATRRGRHYINSMDRYFGERGWNPGAVADVTAAAISLYLVKTFLPRLEERQPM